MTATPPCVRPSAHTSATIPCWLDGLTTYGWPELIRKRSSAELLEDDKNMNADGTETPDQLAALADVNTWFAERGFRIVPSTTDFAEAVRSSPWGKRAPSRDHHEWVHLARPDGSVISPGYGSGHTLAEAAVRARLRWQEEQERGKEPGQRRLP
jgi:hypothetical protein